MPQRGLSAAKPFTCGSSARTRPGVGVASSQRLRRGVASEPTRPGVGVASQRLAPPGVASLRPGVAPVSSARPGVASQRPGVASQRPSAGVASGSSHVVRAFLLPQHRPSASGRGCRVPNEGSFTQCRTHQQACAVPPSVSTCSEEQTSAGRSGRWTAWKPSAGTAPDGAGPGPGGAAHGSPPPLWSQRLRRLPPAATGAGAGAGTGAGAGAGGAGAARPEALVGLSLSMASSSSSSRRLSAMFFSVLSRSRASCCSRITSANVRTEASGVLSAMAKASLRVGEMIRLSRRLR